MFRQVAHVIIITMEKEEEIKQIYANALGDIDKNDSYGQGYLKALKEIIEMLEELDE